MARLARVDALFKLSLLPRTWLGNRAFGLLWEDIHSRPISWARRPDLEEAYFHYLTKDIVAANPDADEKVRNLMISTNLPLTE